MATYYRYFRAGGNYLVLAIVLVVFLMGEVSVCVCVCACTRVCMHACVFVGLFVCGGGASYATKCHTLPLQASIVVSDWWLSDW